MSDYTEEQIEIVVNGIENKVKDDDILMQLFQTGVAFSSLRSLFNGILADKELRMTSKDRKSKTADFLTDFIVDAETSASDLVAKIGALQDELKCSTTQAAASMRTWAKSAGMTLPKVVKEKVAKRVGFSGIIQTLLDHVMENKSITRKELKAYADANNIKRTYVTTVINIVDFAKKFNEPEVEEEMEEAA